MNAQQAAQYRKIGERLAQKHDDWNAIFHIIEGMTQECNLHSLMNIIEAVDPINTTHTQRVEMLAAIKAIKGDVN